MKNKMLRVFSVVLALTLLMLTFAGCNNDPQYEPDSTTSTTEAETESSTEALAKNLNPLTGRADLSDSAIGARPIAIMVENSPEARPQWGLSTPDIVIEGVVEGGITRMMWIYADAEDIPKKVGPTRSARHDYVEIAKGMNAIFVHWGGSNGNDFKSKGNFTLAYQAISNLGVDNIDGMKYTGTYFFRDTTRSTSTEHRGCTSGANVIKAISKLGYSTKQTVEDWKPFNVSPEGGSIVWGDQSVTGSCSSITVTFSQGYVHTFKYDADSKKYVNYLNNKVMTDGNDGKQMAVENVIVMYTPVSTLNTGKGHKEWNMEITNGEGCYVSNGVGQKIYWKKDGKSGALKFYGINGQELTVNSGQTWIGVVPQENRATITE